MPINTTFNLLNTYTLNDTFTAQNKTKQLKYINYLMANLLRRVTDMLLMR